MKKLLCVFLMSLMMLSLNGCIVIEYDDSQSSTINSTNDTSKEEIEVSTAKKSSQSSKEKSEKKNKLLFLDSNLKISFIKVTDGQNLGVTVGYVYLEVENLSDQTLNIGFTDAYANDTAITFIGGTPNLAPKKKSKSPIMFGYNEIFSSVDEIEKLDFKITIYDENFSEIKTTDNITIQLK